MRFRSIEVIDGDGDESMVKIVVQDPDGDEKTYTYPATVEVEMHLRNDGWFQVGVQVSPPKRESVQSNLPGRRYKS